MFAGVLGGGDSSCGPLKSALAVAYPMYIQDMSAINASAFSEFDGISNDPNHDDSIHPFSAIESSADQQLIARTNAMLQIIADFTGTSVNDFNLFNNIANIQDLPPKTVCVAQEIRDIVVRYETMHNKLFEYFYSVPQG